MQASLDKLSVFSIHVFEERSEQILNRKYLETSWDTIWKGAVKMKRLPYVKRSIYIDFNIL